MRKIFIDKEAANSRLSKRELSKINSNHESVKNDFSIKSTNQIINQIIQSNTFPY